jgi:dTDP-glucose 4,6-dehydratase
MKKTILITGGAGFIGSHVIRLFVNKYPNYHIINFDVLSYAGNLGNLVDIADATNYTFVKGDITDYRAVKMLFDQFTFHAVIHLAAESHVDRSIMNPTLFAHTNIMGTANLLQVARESWQNNYENKRFYHVSTDEVYGSLDNDGLFTEKSPYDPRSPYAASKAASDHLVRSYGNTYGLPFVISICSNNYGPNQFPEKLIPLMIDHIHRNKLLPVYGDGQYTRDWLHVVDHARAIDIIFHRAQNGETYNVSGMNEWQNIDLIKLICRMMDEKLHRTAGSSAQLIVHVKDRPGHDRRYALDASKLKQDLDWSPSIRFEDGLRLTIDWYLNNQSWLDNVINENYQHYYQQQYGNE